MTVSNRAAARDHRTLNGASGKDFATSLLQLQRTVRTACMGCTGWEAQIVAGIHATLSFAASHPEAAEALTTRADGDENHCGVPQDEVISYFARLLAERTPDMRLRVGSEEAVVSAIVILVRGHLLAGMTEKVRELAPEAIFLALMPYLGQDAATRWAATPARADHPLVGVSP